MEQKLPQFDPMLSTPDMLRQEAIAVHARLEALQAFMKRQRAITAERQRESPLVLDGRGAQAGTKSHGDPRA
jgi:hypothetical protein